jgi:hypothetical protein
MCFREATFRAVLRLRATCFLDLLCALLCLTLGFQALFLALAFTEPRLRTFGFAQVLLWALAFTERLFRTFGFTEVLLRALAFTERLLRTFGFTEVLL